MGLAGRDEVGIVAESDDSLVAVRQHGGTRDAAIRHFPSTEQPRAQNRRSPIDIDIIFSAGAATRSRQAQSRIARIGRPRRKQPVALRANVTHRQQIRAGELTLE